VIGIDLGKNGGGALGRTMAGFIHGELMPQLSHEESDKTTRTLSRYRSFEMEKDQISRIELKKPGILESGHIVIAPRKGKSEKNHSTAPNGLRQAFDIDPSLQSEPGQFILNDVESSVIVRTSDGSQ